MSAAPTARQRTAQAPDSPEAAYAEAVKRLARQPQSRQMLERRLVHAGYGPAAVTVALDRAQAAGYLNDQEFARSLVRRRRAGRGLALIAQELRAKGIAADAIQSAVGDLEDTQAEQARAVARQILRTAHPVGRAQLRALVGSRLGRRGFPAGLIHRVCAELASEYEAAGRFDTPPEPD